MVSPSQTGSLTTPDGFSLFYRVWRQDTGMPHAVFAIVHGQGEHSGRYQNFADYFVPRGYAVYAIDLRGHGRSDGRRGHVDRFEDYFTDVSTLLGFTRNDAPDRPVFLLGHSMGGLIVLAYALRHPEGLAGVISSGAALRLAMAVPGWKLALGNLASGLVPTLAQPNGLSPSWLSHDPAVVEAYQADPLVHDRITARWSTEFFAAQTATLQNAPRLSLPCLILHGGDDRICDPGGSREFFERAGISNKRHVEYEGLYHEIFNEPEQEQVFADVEAWVQSQLQSSQPAPKSPTG